MLEKCILTRSNNHPKEKQCMKDLGKKLKARPLASMKCVSALKSDRRQLREKPAKKVWGNERGECLTHTMLCAMQFLEEWKECRKIKLQSTFLFPLYWFGNCWPILHVSSGNPRGKGKVQREFMCIYILNVRLPVHQSRGFRKCFVQHELQLFQL